MGKFRIFDPQIRQLWLCVKYGAPVTSFHVKRDIANAIDRDAVEWCNEYAHGRWSRGYKIADPLPGHWWGETHWCFFFKNPSDALLFKLTFGGA